MCTISSLGSSALSTITAQKKGPNKNITPVDLKAINTDGDKTVTVDEMKAAVAKAKGMKPEELTLTEQDVSALTEDAKSLTSLIRRGGALSATKIDNINVFNFNPDTNLRDIRSIINSDTKEKPITLSKGQNTPAVRQLKILLNNLNSNNPNFQPFSVDPKDPNSSKFDDRLFDEVKQFQANPEHGLAGKSTEGVVDKETLTKLVDEANNIIKDDVFVARPQTPTRPGQTVSGPAAQKEIAMNAVREKVYSQLTAKLKTMPEFSGMDDLQLRQVIQERILPVGKGLYGQNAMVMKESEAKTGIVSNGYCASGVKEAMERELHMPYFEGNAADIDDDLRNRGNAFAELKLTKEDILNLPPEMAVLVVHERGHGSTSGHIGVYSTVETEPNSGVFRPSQLSDKERQAFSYPSNKFSAFLPIRPLNEGEPGYKSHAEAFSDNKLVDNVRHKKHDGMKRLTKDQVAQRRTELQGYNQ